MKCPKCNGKMEEGFFIDEGYLGMPVSSKLKWSKKIESSFNVPNPTETTIYRCKSCGYLESYAK